MEYRNILVHLDESKSARTRLDVALRVARRHGAHVSALFAPVVPEHDAAYAFILDAEYWSLYRREHEACRRELEHHFFARLAEAELKGNWRTANHAQHELLMRARFADLIVLGQSNPDDLDASLSNRFQTRVTLSAGRPVLWVPYEGGFPTVGEHVMVAWDAGQSATRALFDALPFMQLAQRTEIVTFTPTPRDRERIPGADIGLVLARHGLEVHVTELHPPPTVTVGEALLARAGKTDCDLIVMGAYGHARWKELLLGGVTQTVLGAMPVPVLMSH
ncbi:universal stress protein [Paraburkholderia oxyphila]|uniref:universal stress protein n=1 Tax=Paraburkholderia oxyphila TaxID=614212 RepID=UPI000482A2E8|nr:universal stress protein [Paraburkholderia oxyphila]